MQVKLKLEGTQGTEIRVTSAGHTDWLEVEIDSVREDKLTTISFDLTGNDVAMLKRVLDVLS